MICNQIWHRVTYLTVARVHTAVMSVRESKKEQTRTALAAAAVELFTEHGYDDVTMAEIAASAGVSRRTAFRYFASKGDLTSVYPDQWRVVFEDSVAVNDHLPVNLRLREAAYRIAADIESDPEPVRQLFVLASAHPALAARYAANSRGWVARVAEEILISQPRAVGEPQVGLELVSAVLGASYMGMIDSACAAWAESGGSLRDLIEAGFKILDDGLASLD